MALSQNAFFQVPVIGQLDLQFSTETISCEVDVSVTGVSPLVAGQFVKLVDSTSGVPTVVACSASSDGAFGAIVYDRMHQSFTGLSMVEVSQGGHMYLNATEAIARGEQVRMEFTLPGNVADAAGHTGYNIVGYAFDKATTAGLIRVKLNCPSFKVV